MTAERRVRTANQQHKSQEQQNGLTLKSNQNCTFCDSVASSTVLTRTGPLLTVQYSKGVIKRLQLSKNHYVPSRGSLLRRANTNSWICVSRSTYKYIGSAGPSGSHCSQSNCSVCRVLANEHLRRQSPTPACHLISTCVAFKANS